MSREHEVFGWSPPPEEDLAYLVDAVDVFLEERRLQVRESTLALYRQILGWLTRELGPEARTTNLSAGDLRGFLDKGSWSPASKRKHLRHVGVFVRWLARKGWLEQDITKEVSLPRCVEHAPKVLTREEERRMIKTLQAHH